MIKIYKIPIILAIFLLLIPLVNSDLDSGYFTLMRIIVCGVSIYLAITAQSIKKYHWMWIIGFLAILFNPLIPIHLEKEAWIGIDFISAIIFLVSVFALSTKENVFKIKTFRNSIMVISFIISIFVILLGLAYFFPTQKNIVTPDKSRNLLSKDFDIKTAEPVVIVEVDDEEAHGFRPLVEFRESVSDEEIKKAICEKFFEPALTYKDDNIIATLTKAHWAMVEKKYSTEKEKWLVFEIEIQAINSKKILYYQGILSYMRDNFGNGYGLNEPWFFSLQNNIENLPKGDSTKGKIYPGDKRTIVLCTDDKLLNNSVMLWIQIPKDGICNSDDIIFKIPVAFINLDLKETLKKKNIKKEIELSESELEDAEKMIPDFGKGKVKKRIALLTEYKIIE